MSSLPFLILFIGAVCGKSVFQSQIQHGLLVWEDISEYRNPMINPGMLEGDRRGFSSEDRNAVPHDYQRWPKGVVPYYLSSSLSDKWNEVRAGMKHIEDKTCIRFVERTNEKNYIRIFKGDGCFADWGLKNAGQQEVSLGRGCHDRGTVVHEFLHAIGLEHEHNRSDRDKYLRIIWDNVDKAMEFNYYKLKPTQNRLLTPFDFDSVMMYEATAFGKKPGLITMEAIDGRSLPTEFDKTGMSKLDVEKVNLLYGCQ